MPNRPISSLTLKALIAPLILVFVTGLRAMVNTLLRSLKLLSDVLVLFLFFLGIMALIGLQLFSGKLRNKCVLNIPDNSSLTLQERAFNESKNLLSVFPLFYFLSLIIRETCRMVHCSLKTFCGKNNAQI